MEYWDMFKARKAEIVQLVESAKSSEDIRRAKEALQSLQRSFNESVDTLPSFDQKSYSGQLAQMGKAVSEKEAQVAPKPKFSFKDKARARQAAAGSSAGASGSAAGTGDSTAPAKALSQHVPAESSVTDVHNTLHTVQRHAGGLIIDRVSNSVIAAESADAHSPSSCHVHNVDRSIINLGRINGSLFMYNISNSIIIAECHQFRIHNSHNVTIALSTSSTAILESCTQLTFVKHGDSAPKVSDFDSPISSTNYNFSEDSDKIAEICSGPALAQLAFLA
ncbi:hypothetical protein E3P99_02673 [Wallemia hederae]|uniref:C-CAP/cofactor C-like domain-containing protein n=1 Tax=Wallemia hederae TaxID=1540922 RepID=A0A4V4LSZ3_9BASI|nr:hypothetical protein E3P99_02673 [Wallemia hederae]